MLILNKLLDIVNWMDTKAYNTECPYDRATLRCTMGISIVFIGIIFITTLVLYPVWRPITYIWSKK